MYQQYFGLTKPPFSLISDPEFLYLSGTHNKVLSALKIGVLHQFEFIVVTGEVGSGKTTLLRKLLDDVQHTVEIGFITNTHPSFGDILVWILHAFGIEDNATNEAERYELFRNFICTQKLNGRRLLLVVDEAQNMDVFAFEELRLLSNINDGSHSLLQIILSGQPELLGKLNDPNMNSFTQRIALEHRLKPLNREETERYILHRLKTAGGRPGIFNRQAISAVFRHSGGIPRVINNICGLAMLFAFANDSNVEYETVMDAIKERRTGGIFKSNPPLAYGVQ